MKFYLDNQWELNMRKNKIKVDDNFVLDEQNNYYVKLYYCLFYKGIIEKQHEEIFKEYEKKNHLPSNNLSRYYHLLKFFFIHNYKFNKIHDKYKINLFIIRKKGMRKDIVENILNQISQNFTILDKILININNKKKFYNSFYGNFAQHEKDILKTNDNQCLAIITNKPNGVSPNKLKFKIRKEYLKYYPPYGNVIHCSDTSKDSEKELKLLLNENLGDFKGVGTYYSHGGM